MQVVGHTLVTDGHGAPLKAIEADSRPVVFFDIDNCLYSKHSGIPGMMKEKIRQYILSLGLDEDEARDLHMRYYKEYGLAIRGLVEHHGVDPLEYDRECDQALPLEDVLSVSPTLQRLLSDIDTSKVRLWALTNAYVVHATRVLKLVGVADFFEGVVSCDYAAKHFACKPEAQFFHEALAHVRVTDPSRVYFVDDSALNVKGAHALGWAHVVLFDEDGGASDPDQPNGGAAALGQWRDAPGVNVVHDLNELRTVWKDVFKEGSQAAASNGTAS